MALYENNAGIKKRVCNCGDSTITAVRKFIRDHPERYTEAGTSGNLTNVLCFVDAYKYRKFDAAALPPFEPEKIARLLVMEADNAGL